MPASGWEKDVEISYSKLKTPSATSGCRNAQPEAWIRVKLLTALFQGSPQYMIQREYYEPTVAAGVRWSPHFE